MLKIMFKFCWLFGYYGSRNVGSPIGEKVMNISHVKYMLNHSFWCSLCFLPFLVLFYIYAWWGRVNYTKGFCACEADWFMHEECFCDSWNYYYCTKGVSVLSEEELYDNGTKECFCASEDEISWRKGWFRAGEDKRNALYCVHPFLTYTYIPSTMFDCCYTFCLSLICYCYIYAFYLV